MATRGWQDFTAADAARHNAKLEVKAKPSKYHAVKTTVGTITFDSAAEARRYGELKVLERAGELGLLELQPRYRLTVTAPVGTVVIGEYRADFRYRTAAGDLVVEDVKGMATPLYRWKKKHTEAQYGVTIVEVR